MRPPPSRRVGAPALPLLVETRFGVPMAGPATLARTGISELLDAYADRRVTLIAAPTGFGKTTALAAWVRARPGPTAWLTLELADDDQVRFTTYLVSAIRRAAPTVGGDALAALQHPRVDIVSRVVGSLVNDLARLDEPVVLVLDDYQHLREPGCHAITRALIAALPEPAAPGHLVAQRPGPAARTAARDRRPRRDPGRRPALLVRGGARLPRRAARRSPCRATSWPPSTSAPRAGRRRSTWPPMSMTTGADTAAFIEAFGTHRHLVDYLAAEVLDRQTPKLRDFLLRTSVLDRPDR